jgi:3-oxoacyl-[acyl-carrier-protein] synthase-3
MLETIVDTTDEWVRLRTGIRSRRIASGGESTLSMAARAAEHALEGIDRSTVGLIVAATITPDYLTPSLSCLLQRELKLPGTATAMDVNAACSGFVVALKTAHAFLADMPGKVALIVGSELLSRIVDYTDRATSILFGDGAGAAVVQRVDGGEFLYDGGASGNTELLACRAQYLCNNPFVSRESDSRPAALSMNGAEVFRFAIETCAESVKRTLARAQCSVGDVDQFIFHQANSRIIDGIVRKIGASPDRCIINIAEHGNTSSATCALALDELFRAGKIRTGDRVVLSAFGAGMTYATAMFTRESRESVKASR